MAVQIARLSEIIDPATRGSTTSDFWFVQPIGPQGTYRRRPPVALFDDSATPTTQSIAREHCAVVQQLYPPLSLVGLREASVAGQGAVLTRSGKLIWESVREFTSQNQTPDGFLNEQGTLSLKAERTREIHVPCLLAKRPWYRNYGHWLVDNASLIGLLADMIARDSLTIVMGDHGTGPMSAVVRDTLDAICPGARCLTLPDDETWVFSDLRYVTPLHVPPLFKFPPALEALRKRVLGEKSFYGAQRLFISRGTHPSRGLVNEDEIFEICQARGFVRVQPEHLSFRGQAELFADAEAVIGVKGAALANCLFCSPNAKVMVMSPEGFPDPFFWDICGQKDMRYGEIYGLSVGDGPPSRRSFTIDAHRFSELMDIVLNEPS